jgi:hypothetical protein
LKGHGFSRAVSIVFSLRLYRLRKNYDSGRFSGRARL